MSAKRKLLIFIPDGTGIKNYLLSDFIKLASENFEIFLAHNFNLLMHDEISIPKSKFTHVNIPEYKENIKHKLLRESLCFARLTYNANLKSNKSILENWRRKFKKLSKRFFYKQVEKYGLYLSKEYSRIAKLTTYYHQNIIHSSSIHLYLKLLQDIRPDLIFTTHQRALYNIPLFAAAGKMDITTVSVIYSWDNMPKARIPFYSDYFFVWSEYMKKEFEDYYPEISADRIKITGTPQFEFYLDPDLLESKTDFFNRYGLDINRPLVCYSGDDKLTSPFDADYLRDMAQSFSKIKKEKRPQIILRPSPIDDGKRFQWVLKKFPEIKYAPADWFHDSGQDNWTVKFPKKNDIKALVNLACHADAVVNLGSTMAHDFAIFNKPAFYLNYMPVPSEEYLSMANAKKWSVETIYKYQHFQSIGNLDPVYWIKNKNDYNKIVDIIMHSSHPKKDDQQLWKDKIIGENLYKKSSQYLNEELLHLI